ncbi:MAG: glycine cleavage system protein GcvH [Gammaproteobacteria bacterium]|jgi:glycine cleavage system H protein
MSNIPADLMFTSSHEWVKDEGDDTVTIGITDHAQELLGDLVFVELPEIGDVIETGGEAGVVESVKAASDIYSPVSGEVIEINEDLVDSPELVNEQPYDNGWIYKMKLNDASEIEALLDAEAYSAVVESEDH